MRFLVFKHVGRWRWSLHDNEGFVLAACLRSHDSAAACFKQIREVIKADSKTPIETKDK